MLRRPIRTSIATGSGSLSHPTRRSSASAASSYSEAAQRNIETCSSRAVTASGDAESADVTTARSGPSTNDPSALCEHMFVAEATILHADVDSFYASIEQRDDPRLRGRPVIVGAGVVLAASYEAKAYGVRTAMGGAQARSMCPDAAVVRPRMSAYAEASKAVFAVFENTTPLVEGLSIDEAFLDVRGLRRISGTAVEIAARLRREVRERVGLPITVGVA